MKKSLVTPASRLVLIALILSLAIVSMNATSNAWFLSNGHLGAASSPIYAVNQGFGGELMDSNLQRIYQSESQDTQVMLFPGDLVYYSFVFQVDKESLLGGQTTYSVDLSMIPDSAENKTVGKGDTLSFLHNCRIQQNACFASVLSRGVNDANGSIYYDRISFVYENGSYRLKEGGDPDDTAVSLFNASTPGVTVSNTEVASFCANPAAAEPDISAIFNLTLPVFDGALYPADTSDDGTYVYYMLYVPIWYIDTGENQNNEMYSILKIEGCTLLPVGS